MVVGLDEFKTESNRGNAGKSRGGINQGKHYGTVPIERESEDPYEFHILLDKLRNKGFEVNNDLIKDTKVNFDSANQENEINDINSYVSQYFDGEGNLRIRTHQNGSCNTGFNLEPFVKANQHFNPRAAGLIDGEGTIAVTTNKSSSHSIGYRTRSVCTISQHFSHLPPLFRYHILLYEFCNSIGITYNYSVDNYNGNVSHEWRTSSLDDVKTLLDTIQPYLLLKTHQAKIFLEEIYPIMSCGKHNTKTGFLKVMKSADKMAELRDSNTGDASRKYNYEYFTEKLGWSE